MLSQAGCRIFAHDQFDSHRGPIYYFADKVEATCVTDQTPGIEVDQPAIAVCRHSRGLAKAETSWGTLADPWTGRPKPICGFTFVGTDGTLSFPEYESKVTVQTRARPGRHEIAADLLSDCQGKTIECVVVRIRRGETIEDMLEPGFFLKAQGLTDTAARNAADKRTLGILS